VSPPVTLEDLRREYEEELRSQGGTTIAPGTSIGTRQNNPGNIRDTPNSFKTFATPQEGFQALMDDVKAKQSGNNKHGLGPHSSLQDFFEVYAPRIDNNDPTAYAQAVASRLGVTPDTEIGGLDTKRFAQEIARHESPDFPLDEPAQPSNGKPTISLEQLRQEYEAFSKPKPTESQADQTTHVGIAQAQEENIQKNVAALKALQQKPGISVEQKNRIQKMLDRYETPTIAGVEVGQRVTQPGRSEVSNYARGLLYGGVNYGVLGASGLVADIASIPLSLLPEPVQRLTLIPQFRERLAEARQIIKEGIDPQGYAGSLGTVVGTFATPSGIEQGLTKLGIGSEKATETIGRIGRVAITADVGPTAASAFVNPFAVLNSASMKAVMGLPVIGPKAAAIIVKGLSPGATFLQRFAANMTGSATLDAGIFASTLIDPNMSSGDKATAITMNVLASMGSALGASIAKNAVADAKKQGPVEDTPTKPGGAPPADRQAQLDQMTGKISEQEAKQKAVRAAQAESRKAAQDEWKAANPDKDWLKDLKKQERAKIVADYRKKNAPAPTPSAEPTAADPIAQAQAQGLQEQLTARIIKLRGEQPDSPPATVMRLAAEQVLSENPAAPQEVPPVSTVEPTASSAGEAPSGEGVPGVVGEITPDPQVDSKVEEIQRELSVVKQERDQARRLAETDQLTGLGNKDAFIRARGAADADPDTDITYLDVTNFKAWNDQYGNDKGDELLKELASAIQTATAAHDAPIRVFRQGDEFFVIHPKGLGPQIAETAKQIAGVTYADKFPIGLRAASGSTFAEAIQAMKNVKAGETGPKYRSPLPDQVIAGVQLKKPLEQHTVDELDKVSTQLDRAYDKGEITEEQYNESDNKIFEAKIAIVNGVVSKARTGEGLVGAAMDPSLLKKLGANLYKGSIRVVAMKESIQNAVDSARGTGTDVNVVFGHGDNSFTIEDHGSGMLPAVAENEFMDVGGSMKLAGSSGGYGLAKVGILTSAAHFEMNTAARDANGVVHWTRISGSGDDWVTGKLKFETEEVPSDTPTGTSLRILLSSDAQGTPWGARDFVKKAMMFSRGDARITLDGEEAVPEKVSPTSSIYEGIGADTEFIHSEGLINRTADSPYLNIHVLNNGLYQFTITTRVEGRTPRFLIADVHPKVSVEDSMYPFTTSREELKGEAAKAIEKYTESIRLETARTKVHDLVDQITNAPSVHEGHGRIVDTSVSLGPELTDDLAKSRSMATVTKTIAVIIRRLSEVLDRKQGLISMGRQRILGYGGMQEEPIESVRFLGIGTGKTYLGLNISHKALAQLASTAELQGIPGLIENNQILINPFAIFDEVMRATTTPQEGPTLDDLASHTMGTILHEILHQVARDHNENFSGVFTRGSEVADQIKSVQLQQLRDMWGDILRVTREGPSEFELLHERVLQAWEKGNDDEFRAISSDLAGDQYGSTVSGAEARHELSSRQADAESIQGTGPRSEADVQAGSGGGTKEGSSASLMEAAAEQRRLAEIEDQARKSRPDGMTLHAHPAVTGFVGGFAAGLVLPADDDQERFRNALYLGVLSAAGTSVYLRRIKTAQKAATPEYQQKIQEHVKSIEDAPLEKRVGAFTRLRQLYGDLVRRDIGISDLSSAVRDQSQWTSGKKAELYGMSIAQADNWVSGGEGDVGYLTRQGEFVPLPIKSLAQIAQMVGGDTRTVGDLAAAHLEITLRGLEKPRSVGLDLETAKKMYLNTPQKYHEAVGELFKWFRGLKEVQVQSGLLSREESDKMNEQSFYVAIVRLFKGQAGKQAKQIGLSGQKTGIGQERPIKAARGSKLPIQNPFEAAFDLAYRYMRAAESNMLRNDFIDELMTVPKELQGQIGRRLTRAEDTKVEGEDAKVAQLKEEFESAGIGRLSEESYRAIVTSLSDESLNATSDRLHFFRNGVRETWRVSDPIAKSFRSLNSQEMAMVREAVGIPSKFAQYVRAGVTGNPVFISRQAFRDIWQYHQNGTYAPLPGSPLAERVVGSALSLPRAVIGEIHGYLAQMLNTKGYQEYVKYRRGGESIVDQGLRVIRGDIKKSKDVLSQIQQGPRATPGQDLLRSVKQLDVRSAYSALMRPVADAGRIGAYLHERGRGAAPIEAVYRATKAGANFSNRGASAAMLAMDRATLFLNASAQSLDASAYAYKRDPLGYIMRGVIGTTLPTIYLWLAHKDDPDIEQLRSTPDGYKYWFTRIGDGPNNIVKIPRQIVDGIVFGATAEAVLDAKYKDDPLTMRKWMESFYNDASVNLLPIIGVVPVGLWTGKNLGTGGDITPPGTENLDVEYRAGPRTSTLARLAGKVTGPIARTLDTKFTDNMLSPSGIEFIADTWLGGLRTELGRALSTAVDAQATGEIPPKEELPFVRSVFAQYPTLNSSSIQEFYRMADRAETASSTALYLARTKPDELADYLDSRGPELMLAKLYSTARSQIRDYRRAIEDLREAPLDVVDPSMKRELINTYMRLMIDQAKQTNEIARSINQMSANAAQK
jgi:diguanylate cyclase (GGDEF)-like protein